MATNVLGTELIPCSTDPITGFFRDGSCHTCGEDTRLQTVCAQMTERFLRYSNGRGMNLMNPVYEKNFPGLKPGDYWCVPLKRWLEAHEVGLAPPIRLEATHSYTLEFIDLETLQQYAVKD